MALPTLRSCSATIVKSGSADNAPLQPSPLANGDIVAAGIAVGANVQPGKPSTFTYEYQSASALFHPGGNYSWERYAGDTGDPSGSGTYAMTPGTTGTNSGLAAAFKDCINIGNPWGPKVEQTAAAASSTPSVTLPNGQYATDDLLVAWVFLNAARTIADPGSWARGSITLSAGLHMWTMRATTGDVVFPSLALSGGTAQCRVVVTSLKKQPPALFGSVIVAGVQSPLSGKVGIIGGVSNTLTLEGSVVNGAFNPRT